MSFVPSQMQMCCQNTTVNSQPEMVRFCSKTMLLLHNAFRFCTTPKQNIFKSVCQGFASEVGQNSLFSTNLSLPH